MLNLFYSTDLLWFKCNDGFKKIYFEACIKINTRKDHASFSQLKMVFAPIQNKPQLKTQQFLGDKRSIDLWFFYFCQNHFPNSFFIGQLNFLNKPMVSIFKKEGRKGKCLHNLYRQNQFKFIFGLSISLGLMAMLLLAHKNWRSYFVSAKHTYNFTDFYVLKEASEINRSKFKQAQKIEF